MSTPSSSIYDGAGDYGSVSKKSSNSSNIKPTLAALEEEEDSWAQYVRLAASGSDYPKRVVVDEDEEASGFSFWDVLLTYLPFVAVWLKQSMFGTANLVRSVVVGTFVRFLINQVEAETWMMEHIPGLYKLLSSLGVGSTPHSHGARAWPPPAFTLLALFTIFTLVVHPDGFTWVLLKKIRDLLISFVRSTATFWAILVQDFGLIPTLAAAATFASLIGLLVVMHRTLSPRSTSGPKGAHHKNTGKHSAADSKRKKKRKGHHHNHGRGVKSGSSTGRTPRSAPNSPQKSSLDVADHGSTISAQIEESPETILPQLSSEKTSTHDQPLKTTPHSSAGASSSSTDHFLPLMPLQGALTYQEESQSVNRPERRLRSRIPSVSTIDSSTISDDVSCESTSVRSGLALESVEENTSSATKARSNKAPASTRKPKGPRKSNPKNAGSKKPLVEPPATTSASRWDALRPGHQVTHHYGPSKQKNAHTSQNKATSKPSSRASGNRKPKPAAAASKPLYDSRPRAESYEHPKVTVGPKVLAQVSSSTPVALPPPPPGLGFDRPQVPATADAIGGVPLTPPRWKSSDTSLSLASPSSLNWNCAPAPADSLFSASPVGNDAFGGVPIPAQSNSLYPATASRPFGGVQDNPFASDIHNNYSASFGHASKSADMDSQIEADLQELGGQMAVSILD